ncbi:MAG: stress response translation initiation inhibitor YciH [Thermoplasmata archaeon]|nr:stress response translation initiation inhibitor YciH [Thermoplasmata archaeon]
MPGVCPVCGLPEDLCICEQIAKETQQVKVYTDKRRYGKTVTIVEGIDGADIDMHELARKLKTKCASGGTVKDGRIELQGDHKKKVQDSLEELGFKVEVK